MDPLRWFEWIARIRDTAPWEWIFSGIGVAALAGLWRLIYKKRHAQDASTVDINALVDQLARPYQQQHADAQQREHMYQEEIQALRAAVQALVVQQDTSDAPPGIDEAIAQLQKGNTEAAEAIFEAVAERKAIDIQEAAVALRHLGALAFLHDTDKALRAYRRAVELDPDNSEGWTQLGHLLVRIGQLDDATAAYQRVLTVGEDAGDDMLTSIAYGNLGIVYRTRGDLERAEEMHRQALALNEALGHKEGMASAYGNLGIVYQIRGDLERAEETYRQALALNEALGHKEGMATAYTNLGTVYQIRGDLERAEEMYRQALVLFQELGATPQVKHAEELLRTLGAQGFP